MKVNFPSNRPHPSSLFDFKSQFLSFIPCHRFHIAFLRGSLSRAEGCIAVLIESGANPQCETKFGETALQMAIVAEDATAIMTLIKYRAEVFLIPHALENDTHSPLYLEACAHGFL